MSRIIGEKNTDTCIMRKYSSMQSWPKDYCICLHPFCIMLEKSADNSGSPQPPLLVKQFLSPFSRPPGNNWDFWRTLGTPEDLQVACLCWQRVATRCCDHWRAPATDGTAEDCLCA